MCRIEVWVKRMHDNYSKLTAIKFYTRGACVELMCGSNGCITSIQKKHRKAQEDHSGTTKPTTEIQASGHRAPASLHLPPPMAPPRPPLWSDLCCLVVRFVLPCGQIPYAAAASADTFRKCSDADSAKESRMVGGVHLGPDMK